jgi:hypothetical protein
MFRSVIFAAYLTSVSYSQAMVFMDDDVLGWQPLAEAWLNERSSALERKVSLRDMFNQQIQYII